MIIPSEYNALDLIFNDGRSPSLLQLWGSHSKQNIELRAKTTQSQPTHGPKEKIARA
jgi:hypothetical protein